MIFRPNGRQTGGQYHQEIDSKGASLKSGDQRTTGETIVYHPTIPKTPSLNAYWVGCYGKSSFV